MQEIPPLLCNVPHCFCPTCSQCCLDCEISNPFRSLVKLFSGTERKSNTSKQRIECNLRGRYSMTCRGEETIRGGEGDKYYRLERLLSLLNMMNDQQDARSKSTQNNVTVQRYELACVTVDARRPVRLWRGVPTIRTPKTPCAVTQPQLAHKKRPCRLQQLVPLNSAMLGGERSSPTCLHMVMPILELHLDWDSRLSEPHGVFG